MRNAFIGVAVAALAAFGLWSLTQPSPPVAPAWIGFALFALGAVFGLRTSANSAARLLADMLRLNRFLADQNTDLAEQNYHLLRKQDQRQEK